MNLPRIAPPQRRRRERGFTLLEVMVVVAILGLMAALVGPALLTQFSKAKVHKAELDIKSLSQSLELYKLDVGGFPTTDDGLQALMSKPSDADSWGGPYIKGGKMPTDPWKRPYIYHSPSTRQGLSYDICSYGEHGQPGNSSETICNNE
jgi:general secretion pathway protein G